MIVKIRHGDHAPDDPYEKGCKATYETKVLVNLLSLANQTQLGLKFNTTGQVKKLLPKLKNKLFYHCS